MNVIGLDIGGANLKASDGIGQTVHVPFPLWQQPEQLAEKLRQLLAHFVEGTPVAVTMTGELADCFRTRAAGVQAILDAVEQAAAGRLTMVWQTTGEFVSLAEAREFPILAAAANWHALATWAGRMAPLGMSLLIDIGSTTTDFIPLEYGTPLPWGRTDLERLESGELQYLGVRRTPVCSLISRVMLRGQAVGVARELFATTLDAHLWLGLIAEQPEDCNTANGQPCTRAAAGERLARMVCSDLDELAAADIQEIAQAILERELKILQTGLLQVLARNPAPGNVLLTGEGEFLARQLLNLLEISPPAAEILSLSAILGAAHSQGACAFALARLAGERFHDSRSGE